LPHVKKIPGLLALQLFEQLLGGDQQRIPGR
jgi:hypothetical protein